MDNRQKHKSKLYGSKTKFTVSANHAFYKKLETSSLWAAGNVKEESRDTCF